MTMSQPARHQVVACTLRGAADQDRCLDLEEALAVEEVADALDDPVPEPQVVTHHRTSEVEITVAESQLLVHGTVLVDREGRGARPVEDLDLVRVDLDLPGGKLFVLCTRRPRL